MQHITWLNLWYLLTFIGWFVTTIAAYPKGVWAMFQASFIYYTVWMLGFNVRHEKAIQFKRLNRHKPIE